VKSNDKVRARVNALRAFLSQFDHAEKDPDVVFAPDPNGVTPEQVTGYIQANGISPNPGSSRVTTRRRAVPSRSDSGRRNDDVMPRRDPRDRLAEDPRTVGLDGRPRTLKTLASAAGRLWTLLGPEEPAVWAALSFGPLQPIPLGAGQWARMKSEGQTWVVVRTPTPLIALQPVIGPVEVAILTGPWQLEVIPPSAQEFRAGATVTGPDASMLLNVTDEDLGHLQWVTHCEDSMRPPGPAPQRRASASTARTRVLISSRARRCKWRAV